MHLEATTERGRAQVRRRGWLLVAALVMTIAPSISVSSGDADAARTWQVAPWGDDDGAGTIDDPFATVQRAVLRAASGDTIELRGGVYHQSVQVFRKSLTIRSRDGERAVFDGAVPIEGFREVGGRWFSSGWTTQFAREPSGGPVDADRIVAGYPDQVFLDGRPLRQVLALGEVVPGTFFHETGADRIWLGDDPRGRLVEISRHRFAIYLNEANGSRLERLTARRYATEATHMGAIRAYADDVTIDRVDIHLNARIGLSAIGRNIVVRDSSFTDNGYLGVHGDELDTFVVERSTISGNNRAGFDPFHSAAGIKVTRSTGVTIRDSDVSRNGGPGVWTDLDTRFVTVAGNRIEWNDRAGVEVELSSDVNVLSNAVLDNGEAGIWILESQNVQVLHNASFGNRNAIEVEEGPRREVRNVRVMNNTLGRPVEGTRALLDVNDWTEERSGREMGVVADYNAYWIGPDASPRTLSRWAEWPAGLRWSDELDEHQLATGRAWNSVVDVDSAVNPFVRDPVAGDVRGPDSLRRGAPVTGSAASELGMADGERRRIGPVAPVPPSGG